MWDTIFFAESLLNVKYKSVVAYTSVVYKAIDFISWSNSRAVIITYKPDKNFDILHSKPTSSSIKIECMYNMYIYYYHQSNTFAITMNDWDLSNLNKKYD